MKQVVTFVLMFIMLSGVAFALSPVIKTTEDQGKWDVVLPDMGGGSYSGPVFLALDSISTEDGEDVNYILVCRNEAGGAVECSVDVNEHSSSCSGTETCVVKGYVRANNDHINVVAQSGDNQLLFKLPNSKLQRGIISIFNSPDLELLCELDGNDTVCDELEFYEPMVNGSRTDIDYGEYEWELTNLDGVEDQLGNEIDKYYFSSVSFLPGEGILSGYELVDENSSLIQKGAVGNGGFEQGLSGWVVDSGDWSTMHVSREGDQSVRIISNLEDTDYHIYQDVPVIPDTDYTLSAWIKTGDVKKEDQGVYLEFQFRDHNNDTVKTIISDKYGGTIDWIQTSRQTNSQNSAYVRIIARINSATGEAWFDDVQIESANKEIMWLSEGGFGIRIDDKEAIADPKLEIEYEEDDTGSYVIANNNIQVHQKVFVDADGERSQVINLKPNYRYESDVIKDSCEDCDETFILEGRISREFIWEEQGAVVKTIGDELKEFTDDEQIYAKKYEIVNKHSSRSFPKVKAAVLTKGECVDRDKSLAEIDWLNSGMKAKFCYAEAFDIGPGESVQGEVFYKADFVDVELGPVEQDPYKVSTLDKQYLRREVMVDIDESLGSIDFEFNIEMPGNCTDCTVSLNKGGLVLYLPFDDDVNDYSTNENDGTLIGGGDYVDGRFGKALVFDGANQNLKMGSFTPLGNMVSFSIWFKTSGNSGKFGHNPLFRTSQVDYKSGLTVIEKGGAIRLFGGDGANFIDCESQVNADDSSWHQFAGTYVKGNIDLYFDGNFVQNCPTLDSMNIANDLIEIGTDYTGNVFNGTIDEIRIWDKLLSPEELRTFFNTQNNEENENSFVYSVNNRRIGVLDEEKILNETNQVNYLSRDLVLSNPYEFDLNNITVNLSVSDIVSDSIKFVGFSVNNISTSEDTLQFVVSRIEPNSSKKYQIQIEYSTTDETVEESVAVEGNITNDKDIEQERNNAITGMVSGVDFGQKNTSWILLLVIMIFASAYLERKITKNRRNG
jgi:hypothetical protein